MFSLSLSIPRSPKGMWAGVIIAEIIAGLTAIIIPLPYVFCLILIIPVLGLLYAKPLFGLLFMIPFLPNVLIKLYSVGSADITMLEITLFLAILCWIISCIRDDKIVVYGTGSDFGLFLLVIWCIISVFWSPSISRGMYQIIKMIPGLLLYYLHVNMIKNKRDFDLLLSAWIAMAALYTIIGFYETVFYGMEAAAKFAGSEAVTHLTRAVRANVFFKSPDDLGFILSICIVVAITKFTTTRSRLWKTFLFVLLPLMLFVLLSTFSRKSILGLFIASAYLCWQDKRLMRSFLGISTVGAILLLLLGSSGFLEVLGNRVESYFMSPEISIKNRVQLWELGWQLFTQSPLLGNGLGSFFLSASVSDFQFGSIHSFYLFVLCELGLIGFAILLLWIFQIAQLFRKFFKLNTEKGVVLTGKAIVGGYLVLGIQGAFRAMNLIDPIFWGFLGLSAAFLATHLPGEKAQ